MLQFLVFESQDGDEGQPTWESMASVAPTHWPALWHEAHGLLSTLARLLPNGPHPLDEGADWDLLLQTQADDAPPHTLHWSPGETGVPAVLGQTGDTQWLALTVTVALSAASAAVAEGLFEAC